MTDQSFLRTPKPELRGQGGRRKGFVSRNEIEDMRLFDADPGKNPSQENGKPPFEPQERQNPGEFVSPSARLRSGGKH